MALSEAEIRIALLYCVNTRLVCYPCMFTLPVLKILNGRGMKVNWA